jgi:tetratricopeptide (TPR) repeat protein
MGCFTVFASGSAAADEVEGTESVPDPIEEIVETPVAPMSVEEQIEEAVSLRRVGAFDAARDMLEEASREPGTWLGQIEYQQGILYETTEQWDKAIAVYTRISERDDPHWAVAQDARFRLAYCMEEVGRHKEAIRIVKELRTDGDWTMDDERTMALQQGIVEIRAGRERRGIRRVLAALDSQPDARTWVRAKARLALVRVQLDTAANIEIKGDKKAARRLARRDELMTMAEKQAIAMFKLGEPEFALEGLLLLGDAYVDLYDDMLEYPPPRSVGPEARDQYREIVRQKAQILLTKAYNRYDEGVRVAARTQWVGSVTDRLKVRRDTLGEKLAPAAEESVTEPPPTDQSVEGTER